jgi:hypothetical protein
VIALSEAEFMFLLLGDAKHTGLVTVLGWTYVHFRPARTRRGWVTPVQGPLGKGWPDLVLMRLRDKRLIFAELKANDGKLTPEQDGMEDFLQAMGFEYHCWRPKDWDEVVRALS